MDKVTCSKCWRSVQVSDTVTLTDVDGYTITECAVHHMTADDLLSRVEAYLAG